MGLRPTVGEPTVMAFRPCGLPWTSRARAPVVPSMVTLSGPAPVLTIVNFNQTGEIVDGTGELDLSGAFSSGVQAYLQKMGASSATGGRFELTT